MSRVQNGGGGDIIVPGNLWDRRINWPTNNFLYFLFDIPSNPLTMYRSLLIWLWSKDSFQVMKPKSLFFFSFFFFFPPNFWRVITTTVKYCFGDQMLKSYAKSSLISYSLTFNLRRNQRESLILTNCQFNFGLSIWSSCRD